MVLPNLYPSYRAAQVLTQSPLKSVPSVTKRRVRANAETHSPPNGPSIGWSTQYWMNTDALITRLSTNVQPVPASAARAALLRAIVAGGWICCSVVLLGHSLSPRPDLLAAVLTGDFWVKMLYTASIAALGFVTLDRSSRPEPDRMRSARLLWLPVGLLCALTAVRLTHSAAVSVAGFWLGSSWWQCPLYITGLSAPAVAALMLTLARLAPARPALAGAAAGLVGGATAATAYALHCAETSPGFVLVWYSLGLAATSAAGALLGSWVLRW